MAGNVTLEHVERMVGELRPSEQLQLAARICEQLSEGEAVARRPKEDEGALRAREERADALLAELDAIAESIPGAFDSAAELRAIRQERADRS